MSFRDFEPCSAEQNQYEMDIFHAIKSWLDFITGIKWISEDVEGDAPDSQYGVISIESITPSTPRSEKRQIVVASKNEACISVTMSMGIDIKLSVYNAVTSSNDTCSRIKTPVDVLMRVFDAYHISRLSKYLADDNIKINSFGQINNFYGEIQEGSFSKRASMTLELCGERKTSYAENAIDGFCLKLKCKNKEDCNGD